MTERSRRTFLKSAAGAVAAFWIPDWGQRVFPMFPRTHVIRLNDEMFNGRGFELRLPWWQMEQYVKKLEREAAGTALVRTSLCDRDGIPLPRQTDRPPRLHVAKTVAELVAEGWRPYELERPVDLELVRASMCKKRVGIPTAGMISGLTIGDKVGIRDRWNQVGELTPAPAQRYRLATDADPGRKLIFPTKVFDTGTRGSSEWVLEQKHYAGGMISGLWRDCDVEM